MIKFKNKEHGKFYERCLGLCGCSDPYHKAFFYTMGISSETRMHIHDCFNFRDDVIRPDCLSRGWQTSGSSRVTRLAFNLWNGWNSDGLATPYAIGKAEPVMVSVDTFGTCTLCADDCLEEAVKLVFGLTPAAIIRQLDLLKPIYARTAAYGHFGRPCFAWERTDKAKELRDAVE